ncbi:hypothetical protein [Roseimicrobium sp. ORNL1]|uniref:hypothetical protein n=1 Tax=Roseimicrobium sp. ORNL1 TaxID=2711231 RepID=UPI0013E1A8C9|nr:hypothetical protein [Roseimicrobium sp. ORNL1]QIF02628.1 hypothetical protein G5S37_14200 [Roseimicrobium sp. ORNL1]
MWITGPLWTPPTDADVAATEKLAVHLRQVKPFNDPDYTSIAYGGWDQDQDIPKLSIQGVMHPVAQERFLDEVRKWKDTSEFDAVLVEFYDYPRDEYRLVAVLSRTVRVELDSNTHKKKRNVRGDSGSR